jgi:hypothetical protein
MLKIMPLRLLNKYSVFETKMFLKIWPKNPVKKQAYDVHG